MAYRVSLTAPAETDAYSAFEYIRALTPLKADQWLDHLFEAVFSLEQFPARCPLIPEAAQLGRPIRHLLFGRASALYRIIFQVLEDDRHVRVLRIWHGSREAIDIGDIEA